MLINVKFLKMCSCFNLSTDFFGNIADTFRANTITFEFI